MTVKPLSQIIHNELLKSLSAAAEMSRVVRNRLDETTIWRKEDRSLVTAADLAAQALILKTLIEHLPGEQVLAEESVETLDPPGRTEVVLELVEQIDGHSISKAELREWIGYRGEEDSDRIWLLDPIDGTKGYVRGSGYALSLATLEEDRVTRSYLAVPESTLHVEGVTGFLFSAVRQEGAFKYDIVNGEVQSITPPPAPVAGRDALVIAATRAHENVDLPPGAAAQGFEVGLLSMDSIAKYAALSTGAAHLYPRKPSRWIGPFYCWDHAAGVLLVEETDGKVTDLTGKSFDWSNKERLIHNKGIFAASQPDLYDRFQPLFIEHIRDIL